MLAFTEVVGVASGGLKVLKRLGRHSCCQGRSAQRPVRVNILGRNQSFAALPGAETPRTETLQGVLPSPALVQQGNELDRQIVPVVDKFMVFFEAAQPLLR